MKIDSGDLPNSAVWKALSTSMFTDAGPLHLQNCILRGKHSGEGDLQFLQEDGRFCTKGPVRVRRVGCVVGGIRVAWVGGLVCVVCM